jgi:hypothetical protein
VIAEKVDDAREAIKDGMQAGAKKLKKAAKKM